jgi:mono/diheme cytochrome c family protein
VWYVIGVALIGLAAGALMWRPPISAVASPTVAHDPETLARGARVVAQGDCIVCHTAEGGAAYAGGLALKTPFGAIYSTNITPDAQTGIGQWTVEAFRRAVRNGISRDGHWLYPAFPYVHFASATDAVYQQARHADSSAHGVQLVEA